MIQFGGLRRHAEEVNAVGVKVATAGVRWHHVHCPDLSASKEEL